jgi:hypothetical protein
VELINFLGGKPIISVRDEKHFLHGSDWLSIHETRKRNKIIKIRDGNNLKRKILERFYSLQKRFYKVNNLINFFNKTLFRKFKYILICYK